MTTRCLRLMFEDISKEQGFRVSGENCSQPGEAEREDQEGFLIDSLHATTSEPRNNGVCVRFYSHNIRVALV